jgi:hypothetical protein
MYETARPNYVKSVDQELITGEGDAGKRKKDNTVSDA